MGRLTRYLIKTLIVFKQKNIKLTEKAATNGYNIKRNIEFEDIKGTDKIC